MEQSVLEFRFEPGKLRPARSKRPSRRSCRISKAQVRYMRRWPMKGLTRQISLEYREQLRRLAVGLLESLSSFRLLDRSPLMS